MATAPAPRWLILAAALGGFLLLATQYRQLQIGGVRADETEASLALARAAVAKLAEAQLVRAKNPRAAIQLMAAAHAQVLEGDCGFDSVAVRDARARVHEAWISLFGEPSQSQIEFAVRALPAYTVRRGAERLEHVQSLIDAAEFEQAYVQATEALIDLERIPTKSNEELRAEGRRKLARIYALAGDRLLASQLIAKTVRELEGPTVQAALAASDTDAAMVRQQQVVATARGSAPQNGQRLAEELLQLAQLLKQGGADEESLLARQEAVDHLVTVPGLPPLRLAAERHDLADARRKLLDYAGALAEAEVARTAVAGMRWQGDAAVHYQQLVAGIDYIRARCFRRLDRIDECIAVCDELLGAKAVSARHREIIVRAALTRVEIHRLQANDVALLKEEDAKALAMVQSTLKRHADGVSPPLLDRLRQDELDLLERVEPARARAREMPPTHSKEPQAPATRGDSVTLASKVLAKLSEQVQLLRAAERREGPRRLRAATGKSVDAVEPVFGLMTMIGLQTPAQLEAAQHALFEYVETARSCRFAGARSRSTSADAEVQREIDRLHAARAAANTAIGQAGMDHRKLERALHQREQVDRDLVCLEAAHGMPLAPAPTVAAVAATLRVDEVAVSFWRPFVTLPRADGKPSGVSNTRYVVFLVFADGNLQCRDLGLTDPVEAAILQYLRPGFEGEDQHAALTLRRELLDPVLSMFGPRPITRILIAGENEVALVPFEALPRDEGGVVGDVLHMRFLPHLRELLAPRPAPQAAASLMTLAAVDFDAIPVVAAGNRGGEGRGGPLVHSLREAEAIEATFRVRHNEAAVVSLRGAAASKSLLIDELQRARHVHLATHGWFGTGIDNSMGRTLAEMGSGSRQLDYSLRLSPLSLCWLSLAGSDLPDNERPPASRLTGEEIAGLDLSGCELVVLSACQTGVGIYQRKDGLSSFQTALHKAGAQNSITTLWPVPDATTAKLMSRFYEQMWQHGKSMSEALRAAQHAMRTERGPDNEPRYSPREWAGFVFCGRGD